MKRLMFLAVLATPSLAAAADPWDYGDPGDLVPGSGSGAEEWTVFAPGMRFPMEDGPAFANSQVYMPGGSNGGGGTQCDAVNYDYPWRDNYCESRSWSMPLCPSGTGHQGQDIRPATCDEGMHWAVAAVDGTITNIGSYSVYLTADDGTRYDYLHTDDLIVGSGQSLVRGDRMSKVSNAFGGTPTTIHLHFNIKQDVAGVGFVYVSPYMSLVHAYEDLMGFGNEPPTGALEDGDCTSIRGWAQDGDAPDEAVEVEVWLGGERGDPAATGIAIAADRGRPDLCNALGSCDHGFELEVPRSFRDGTPHAVHVYASDDAGGETVELDASPGSIECPVPAIPDGVRRLVATPEIVAVWKLSTVWDLANVDDVTLAGIPPGDDLPPEPVLVVADDGAPALWLLDGDVRRLVADDDTAEAWRFSPTFAEVWPADELAAVPEGTAVRAAPFLVRGSGPELFIIDDVRCPAGDADCEDDGGSGTDDEGGADDEGSGNDPDAGDDGGGEGLPPGYGDPAGQGGCGCTGAPTTPAPWSALAPGLVAMSRRRRSP